MAKLAAWTFDKARLTAGFKNAFAGAEIEGGFNCRDARLSSYLKTLAASAPVVCDDPDSVASGGAQLYGAPHQVEIGVMLDDPHNRIVPREAAGSDNSRWERARAVRNASVPA